MKSRRHNAPTDQQLRPAQEANLRLTQLLLARPHRLANDQIQILKGPNADTLMQAALGMSPPVVRREDPLSDHYRVIGNAGTVLWWRLAFPSHMHSRIGVRCILLAPHLFAAEEEGLLDDLPALLTGAASTRRARRLRSQLDRLGLRVETPSLEVLTHVSTGVRATEGSK